MRVESDSPKGVREQSLAPNGEDQMPEELEKILKRKAMEKFGSETNPAARRYIYGTMRESGWKPKREKK